jgi:hypothetical protein
MTERYSFCGWALCACWLLAPASVALAQAPVITSTIPMANARVARNASLTVAFNQPLTTAADATGTARLTLHKSLPAGVYLVRNGGQVRRLLVE